MTIRVSSVRKTFGSHAALDDVSLQIEAGEFFVVLGPSGCGKSTLLRAIAGLEPVDSGEIHLGSTQVAGKGLHQPPEARNVGVVFQSYALWPHMSVRQNVAFPLETAKRSKSYVEGRTNNCLATVELQPFADRKPADLSGGQRQRVALARCLAQGAETVLMDEPLANLDPHLRSAMEEELAEFHKKSGSTTLFITHDQREAMALADKVALMWDGKVLQADTPDMLYDRPVSEKVAGFIGRSTILSAEIARVRETRALVMIGGQAYEVPCSLGTSEGASKIMVRPEHVRTSGDGRGLETVVERVIYRGGYWETNVRIEGQDQLVLVNLGHKAAAGDRLSIAIDGGWVLPD
ncbi:ABC transporter ATP-binding protein [Roseibium algae]|uniref:ABC transporter ATP-binding protein n=1 Tax=Roseibium algae TaxID=3123038 RepID=A0ABU8TFR5_9HYPH